MAVIVRIIQDGARNAAFNMAADQYLLERASVLFLRLYSWCPPAVSVGRMQKPGLILDKKAMAEKNVGWVKRPTGGRAVLHMNDLTYACIFPKDMEEMGMTVNQSYAVISRCLMRSLALAGIPCGSHDSAVEYAATKREIKLPCFLSPNRNEIMVHEKKLIGSAQKRTASAVLQHGSIPIDGSFRKLPEFLAISREERIRQRIMLEKKCICLEEINPEIDNKKLSACLIKGFAETLDLCAVEKPWDKEELEKIGASAEIFRQ